MAMQESASASPASRTRLIRYRQPWQIRDDKPRRGLVNNLQAELDDARLECTCDLSAAVGNSAGDVAQGNSPSSTDSLGSCALGSADGAGQIEVGVIQQVISFGAELDLHVLNRSIELLVEGEVGFVEGRCAGGIADGVAEGAQNAPLKRP